MTGLKRVFIPSKVDNNRHIDVEAYKQRLRASGSKELASAWQSSLHQMRAVRAMCQGECPHPSG